MTGGVEAERAESGALLLSLLLLLLPPPALAAGGRCGELSSGCCAFVVAALSPSPSDGEGDLGGGDPPRDLLLCNSLSLLSPPPPRSLLSPRATSNAALPSSPPTLSGASRIELGSHPLAILMSLLSCLETRDQST